MSLFRSAFRKIGPLRRLDDWRIRLRLAATGPLHGLRVAWGWSLRSRETTNFTYDLTERNRAHLASFVAVVTEKSPAEIRRHIEELESDAELREHIRQAARNSPRSHPSDAETRYGRRLGWYAFVRALKPSVVIETGVDKGLGACVLTAALRRNAAEGKPGRYYGTDINPNAGFLLSGPYAEHGRILYGDSIESLRALDEKSIDLFINDSDHSADYEAREYQTVADRLSPKALIIGDNAHCSDKLIAFAEKTGRRFLFFQERPADHWYPGAGIGVAWRKTTNDRA
jgi:predicted O-methyltransferase YrrM